MDIKLILLKEIKQATISDYQICRIVGINQAIFSRFKNEKKTLNIESAEKLLQFFGYTLAKTSNMPELEPLKMGRPKVKTAGTKKGGKS